MIAVTLSLVALLGVWACVTAPYTKRSQLILLPEEQERDLGVAAYREALASARLVTDPALLAPVLRVGERIARAASKPAYQWEFNLVDAPDTANAFALPGGKVAVYSGLFPVAQDEAGLAAVIGHEVGHALARHGAERMSQGILLQIGAVGLSAAMGGGNPQTQRTIMQAFGLGAQVGVVLPFSRSQESEADHIGMILMAKAGYEPEAALKLWQRMEAEANGKGPPEYLSTHPSAGTRQRQIRDWLPEARRHFIRDPDVVVATLPRVE